MTTASSIDVHAHCVPTEVLDGLRADGDRYGIELHEEAGRARFRIAGNAAVGPLHPGLSDLQRRLEVMDATGVEIQILSPWMDLTAYSLPPEVGARYARMYNEALAATVATRPDRLRGLCTVPLQSSDHAVTELEHAVTSLGMVGAEIGTTVAGQELDHPDLEPFWATAEELGCILFLHPCASLAGRGVTRHFLGNLVGNPAETTIAVGHLVFGGVLERHPDLRLCVAHGGGFAPYQIGRWDHAFHRDARGAAANLTLPPSHWVAQLYHDTVLHSPRSLRLLLDLVGPEHVVLGSDYPFEMGDPDPNGTLAAVPGLSEEDRALVLAGNLERLVGDTRAPGS